MYLRGYVLLVYVGLCTVVGIYVSMNLTANVSVYSQWVNDVQLIPDHRAGDKANNLR